MESTNDISLMEKQIKNLKAEVKKLEQYQRYSELGNEMFAIKEAFKGEGFTEKEAMTLLTTIVRANLSKC